MKCQLLQELAFDSQWKSDGQVSTTGLPGPWIAEQDDDRYSRRTETSIVQA